MCGSWVACVDLLLIIIQIDEFGTTFCDGIQFDGCTLSFQSAVFADARLFIVQWIEF